MTTIHITLPDQLAQEAQNAGLLTPPRLEKWLREQLKAQRIDELFLAMDRMASVEEPAVLSPEEVAAEMAAMRSSWVVFIRRNTGVAYSALGLADVVG